MKEKILELIHKELENVGSENIFHNITHRYIDYWSWVDTPYRECLLESKTNCDEVKSIYGELLHFTLKFPDGDPDINIFTDYKSTPSTELYKTKYFGFKKLYTTITKFTYTTKVKCGHVDFELTEEQSAELLKLTKEAHAKYLILKDEAMNREIAKKINKRLKEHKAN